MGWFLLRHPVINFSFFRFQKWNSTNINSFQPITIRVEAEKAKSVARHQGARPPAKHKVSTLGCISDTERKGKIRLLRHIFALQELDTCEV
jgi:hypothetical protein